MLASWAELSLCAGGHVMRAAFNVFRPYGRMVLCGSISSYNKNKEEDLIPNVLSAKQNHTHRNRR